jgi:predicted transcriptional regulator
MRGANEMWASGQYRESAMEDHQERLTIHLSAKTHHAMLAFLKKHGSDTQDVSRFVEDAITWRIMDREIAFHHATKQEEVSIFASADESTDRNDYEMPPARLHA